jgi:hypothetical protein
MAIMGATMAMASRAGAAPQKTSAAGSQSVAASIRTAAPSGRAWQRNLALSIAAARASKDAVFARRCPMRSGALATTWPFSNSCRPGRSTAQDVVDRHARGCRFCHGDRPAPRQGP